MKPLTDSEREQVAEILSRRANEVAGFREDHRETPHKPERQGIPASVDFALELEVKRLRSLADKVRPERPDDE